MRWNLIEAGELRLGMPTIGDGRDSSRCVTTPRAQETFTGPHGFIAVPEGPGTGVRINHEILKKVTLGTERLR